MLREPARRKLAVSDPVGNDLNSEALGVGNRLLPALAVGHYARKLKSLRDPAAIFLAAGF
jgi:hypothetical protein